MASVPRGAPNVSIPRLTRPHPLHSVENPEPFPQKDIDPKYAPKNCLACVPGHHFTILGDDCTGSCTAPGVEARERVRGHVCCAPGDGMEWVLDPSEPMWRCSMQQGNKCPPRTR